MRTVKGRDAYDLWHLAVRYKELIEIRAKLAGGSRISLSDIPRPNKFILTYLGLQQNPDVTNALELGSSILEIVDGLILVERALEPYLPSGRRSVNSSTISFAGVEISGLLRSAATDAYRAHKVKTRSFGDIEQYLESAYFDKNAPHKNFIHDWGVASYAFNSTADFCDFLSGFGSGMINLAYATNGEVMASIGNKSHLFFDAKMLVERFPKQIFSAASASLSGENWFREGPEKDLLKSCHSRIFLMGSMESLQEKLETFSACGDFGPWLREHVELVPLEDLI